MAGRADCWRIRLGESVIGKGVVNVEDDSAGCMTHGSVIRVSDEGDRAVIRDSDEGDRACVDEAGVAATEASVRAQLDDLSLRVTHLADDIERVSGAWARPDLASALANCQGLINTLTAVQDVAITRLAAIEEEWLEDGLVVESRRAPGHIALALLSGWSPRCWMARVRPRNRQASPSRWGTPRRRGSQASRWMPGLR